MSLLKKLAGQAALYGLSSILGRLLSFVFLTPYLTRKLAPSEMGVQAIIYSWAAFLMIVFTYRIETAFFRFGNEKEARPKVFKTAAQTLWGTTALLTGLLILFAQPIATLLKYPEHSNYIIYFALILGADALSSLPFALLRLQGKAMKFAVIRLSNLFIHLGLVLFFLEVLPELYPTAPKLGIGYVFIANLIASLATFILLLPSYLNEFREHKSQKFDPVILKTMVIYAMPLVLSGFAGIINELIDRMLLKRLLLGDLELRDAQIGIYSSCYKIAIFMHLFTQAFNYAAEPFFFKHKDKSFTKPLYANIASLFALIGSLGFLAIMLFMDIVQYFVADAYREGLVIVPFLLLANLFLGLYYNIAIWYKLSDKTRFGAYISIFGAGITIIGNILLIPYFISQGQAGYLGSAWATLICYFCMVILAYTLGQKHYPIPYQIKRIGLYIASAIAYYLLYINLLYPLVQKHLIYSLTCSSILLLSYFVAVIYVDRKFIRRALKR